MYINYYFFFKAAFSSTSKLCENVKFILRVIGHCLSCYMTTSRNFFVALYEFAFYGSPLYFIQERNENEMSESYKFKNIKFDMMSML